MKYCGWTTVMLICMLVSVQCQKKNESLPQFKWFVLKSSVVCQKITGSKEEVLADKKCSHLPPPAASETSRLCNPGSTNCTVIGGLSGPLIGGLSGPLIAGYRWRPLKWSECSRSCGGDGTKMREVDCVSQDDGNTVQARMEDCFRAVGKAPPAREVCNRVECPAQYIPGPWSKCKKSSRKCMPGRKTRRLFCQAVRGDGTMKSYHRSVCGYKRGSGRKAPPRSWEKCFDHVNTPQCAASHRSKVPLINGQRDQVLKGNTLVQMRPTRKLKLTVGQRAMVLLQTTVVVQCPVTYFVPREVIWRHGNNTYQYRGRVKSRVKVNKKGRIRIKRFRLEDAGMWECLAGVSKATTEIFVRQPSQGLREWVMRTSQISSNIGLAGFQSDSADQNRSRNQGGSRRMHHQWVLSPWSPCSVSCGGKGFQTRQVQCEVLETKLYTIVGDHVCSRRQQKPSTKRSCLLSYHCPRWNFQIASNLSHCSELCLRGGVAQLGGKLTCRQKQIVVPSSKCRYLPKPTDIECPNSRCTPNWKKSSWSQCSRSCGGDGIQGRYLICVWNNTGQLAGSACYDRSGKAIVPIPQIVRPCTAPSCNLRCIDLSKGCRKKIRLCRVALYQFTCCETCSKLVSKRFNKTAIISKKNKRLAKFTTPSLIEKRVS